ncbi:MAG: ATP-binding cassette domain-containing protein, partial [Tissierellia bacterium]|nr:ATP-binding cassette domain-containing protein [Tissierellia bacterium]
MKSFYVLKDFFKDNKKQYALGIFWLILTDTLVLIEPKLIKAVTDGLQFKTMTRTDLLKYVAFIIIIYVFIGLGRYMWRVYLMGNSRKLEYYLRKKYYGHIITLPMSFYNENKVGDLITLGTNDIQNVRSAIGQGAVMLFDSLFLLIMGIFMMISTSNTKLTFMTIATFPLVIIIVARFGRIVYHRSRRVQESFSDLSDVTQESFSGIRVIKSFVKEEDNYQKFKDINNENYNRNIHLTKISAFFRPLSQWVLSISYVILIIFGGRMVINGEISIGDFVACNIYLGILSWPTMALGMVINVIQRGAASMDRLNEIFHTHSNILEIDSPIEMHSPKGKVEFENDSFKYPGAKYNALSNINISIEPHNTLGIIGRTGSGKTTLLNLLCRLMDTTEGAIKIDGVDISDIGIHNLRENISYAPQESFLFSETINYN